MLAGPDDSTLNARHRSIPGLHPIFPFEPQERDGPVQLRNVLEIHAVDPNHENGRDTDDRGDGEHLHHVVLLDADERARRVLEQLNAVEQILLELFQ